MTPEELSAALAELDEPAYRAKQVLQWVFAKGRTDPAEMTNLPARITDRLEVLNSRLLARADSTDGTVKLLIELADGERVEAVMIPADSRRTACVSTQVGCAMGCAFCATARGGLVRNLSAGEILQQIFHLQLETGEAITHVVFMGMGEPLANYDATCRAVRAIVDPDRLGISARRVTISTVGLPREIRRLAGEDLAVTLAISLHAPNDAMRKAMMPAATRAPLEEILSAARAFFEARKREVTLEYLLIGGRNDTPLCADGLAKLAGRLRCNVNVIRYNPVPPEVGRRPSQTETSRFVDRLKKRGVNVHVRQSRGLDTQAACGQLRASAPPGQSAGRREATDRPGEGG
jgi:23S rRNA (adenine2503-C2)-methyltransferase